MARAGRSRGRGRSGGRTTARDYPRTARLNELYREIIGEALTDLDEDWTHEVSITGVDVDNDLRRAKVYFDCVAGAEGDAEAQAHLDGVRWKLQRAVATEARARRAPELVFSPDPGVRAGEHLEHVLRDMPPVTEVPAGADDGTDLDDTAGVDADDDGETSDGEPADG